MNFWDTSLFFVESSKWNSLQNTIREVCYYLHVDEILPDVPPSVRNDRYKIYCPYCNGIPPIVTMESIHNLSFSLIVKQYYPLKKISDRKVSCLEKKCTLLKNPYLHCQHLINKWRQLTKHTRNFLQRSPIYEPIAIPSDQHFLKELDSRLQEYNLQVPKISQIVLFEHETIQVVSAAVCIQSSYRAFKHRQQWNILQLLIQRRAAIVLQRSWRNRIFKSRIGLLSETRRLSSDLTACKAILKQKELDWIRNKQPTKTTLRIEDGNFVYLSCPLPPWIDQLLLSKDSSTDSQLEEWMSGKQSLEQLLLLKSSVKTLIDRKDTSEEKHLMLTFPSVVAARKISVVLLLLTWSHLEISGVALKSFRRANIQFQTNIDPSSTVESLTTKEPDSDQKDKQKVQHTSVNMIAMARYYEEAYKAKRIANMKTENAYFNAQIDENKELIESENKRKVEDFRLSYGMTILTIAQSVKLVQHLRQHLSTQNTRTKEQLQATHKIKHFRAKALLSKRKKTLASIVKGLSKDLSYRTETSLLKNRTAKQQTVQWVQRNIERSCENVKRKHQNTQSSSGRLISLARHEYRASLANSRRQRESEQIIQGVKRRGQLTATRDSIILKKKDIADKNSSIAQTIKAQEYSKESRQKKDDVITKKKDAVIEERKERSKTKAQTTLKLSELQMDVI